MENMIEEYIIFGVVVLVALVLDMFVLAKRGQDISFRSATIQSVFWIALSLAFGYYVYVHHGYPRMVEYYTAYLMEKSLSMDNIVVFIMIFNTFQVPKKNIYTALTIGILLAIILRVVFIVAGVALVSRFEIILVFFGLFLLITAFRMMVPQSEEDEDVREGRIYKFISSRFPIDLEDHRSRMFSRSNGKRVLTQFGLVVIMISFTDFIFALDSLPTVLAISQDQFVVLSSNVFAVLGLRALYYLMQNAIEKFQYLQQGVAFVLFFIGAKLIVSFLGFHIPENVSLFVVLLSLGFSIIYSVIKNKQNADGSGDT